jgi:phosphatidylserine decarboxylase
VHSVRPLSELTFGERLNFLVTNRIPRRTLTRLAGWFSRIENPLVRDLTIGIWRLCVDDLRLGEAKKPRFDSLHDCFIRELAPGARPVDPDAATLVSPCDAVVGEFGALDGIAAIQAKGFPYSLAELLGGDGAAEQHRGGLFVTLRLKSSMYHRFHAPCDARIDHVDYISGDTWNVNPIALKRIERLYCRNERAVIDLDTGVAGEAVTLVPVAAILVASLRLTGADEPLRRLARGSNRIPFRRHAEKGEELGYFEHGSTIVMLAKGNFRFVETIATGTTIRMGQPLLHRNDSDNLR